MSHNHTITQEEQIFKVTTIAPIVLEKRKELCRRVGSGVKSHTALAENSVQCPAMLLTPVPQISIPSFGLCGCLCSHMHSPYTDTHIM